MDDNVKIVYKIKKSTGKTVTIVILVFLLLGCLSYIGYTEYQKMYEKKHQVETETVEKEIYYSEVATILKQIDKYNYVLKSAYPIKNVNKIDNQLKLQFGIYALTMDENTKNYYKIDDMEDIYTRYFTKDFKAIYEDINCPFKDGKLYKLENETFIDNSTEHGHGKISMDTNTYFVNGKIDKDEYIIDTHILYGGYCNGVCGPSGGYFKSYDDSVDGNNPIINKLNEYEEVESELPITRFTFKKYRDKFLLKSVEIE